MYVYIYIYTYIQIIYVCICFINVCRCVSFPTHQRGGAHLALMATPPVSICILYYLVFSGSGL